MVLLLTLAKWTMQLGMQYMTFYYIDKPISRYPLPMPPFYDIVGQAARTISYCSTLCYNMYRSLEYSIQTGPYCSIHDRHSTELSRKCIEIWGEPKNITNDVTKMFPRLRSGYQAPLPVRRNMCRECLDMKPYFAAFHSRILHQYYKLCMYLLSEPMWSILTAFFSCSINQQ